MSQFSEKSVYLGKAGKIFGPYTSKEIDQMRVDGRIDQYVWIWSDKENKWNPLELPPASPLSGKKASGGAAGKTSEVSGREVSSRDISRVHAVCYDHSEVLQGHLESLTQTGCLLVCENTGRVPPVLNPQRAFLSLVEKDGDQSYTVPVKVFKQALRDGNALYWLRWENVPSIFS